MIEKLEIGSLYKLNSRHDFRVGSVPIDYSYIHPKDNFIFLFLGTNEEYLLSGGLLNFNVFLCLNTGKKCYDAVTWEKQLLESLYEFA